MAKSFSHSKSVPARMTGSHITLSLGNQDSNMPTSFQKLNTHPTHPTHPPPTESIDKIPTYFIWSIFNLLFIPFGILCCYFSHKVNQFKIQNHYELAKEWSQRTYVLNIITTLLMVCFIITVVMLNYDHAQRNSAVSATTIAYIPWQPGR